MSDFIQADISEFQESVDATAYRAAGHQCIICRAHNGFRLDKMWPGRRDYLRAHNFTALGFYLYLVAGRDPASQAHDFCMAVGSLRANEYMIVDHEEGAGDQSGRCQSALSVVDQWAGQPTMLYAGEAFLRDQLGGAGHYRGRPIWIAAYRSSEPTTPHTLWQFTDKHRFAGIAGLCDASLYHGLPMEYLGAVRTGHVSPGPLPPFITIPEDSNMITAATSADGNLHVFQEMPDHSIWYTWQRKGENTWNGGVKGKQVAGMSPFAPAPKK